MHIRAIQNNPIPNTSHHQSAGYFHKLLVSKELQYKNVGSIPTHNKKSDEG